MHPITRALATAGLLLLVVAGVAWAAGKDEAVTFRGEYDWTSGGSDRLEAEFKPAGDGSWKVTFRFDFSGKGNTWKGTARGGLADGGEVEGTATWKRSGRSWVFRGTIEDGVFSGSHAELRDGRESASGTFRLTR